MTLKVSGPQEKGHPVTFNVVRLRQIVYITALNDNYSLSMFYRCKNVEDIDIATVDGPRQP